MINPDGTLYTFGCSLTSYNWPTWADILGKEFKKFENWGRPGAGNNFIFNSLIECLSRNQISKNDTVIIMWSGITRIDCYQMNEWSHYHSVFDKNLPVSCPYGAEIISYALFCAADKLLSLLGVKYYMLSFLDYDSDSKAGLLYKNTLDKITKINFPMVEKEVTITAQHKLIDVYTRFAGIEWPKLEEIFKYDKSQYSAIINAEVAEFIDLLNQNKHLYFTKIINDSHPTPNEHLEAINTVFKISFKESTKIWAKEIDHKIRHKESYFFNKLAPERL
jgi:hypothetical protein